MFTLGVSAQSNSFGHQRRGHVNPFRINYFSYDINHPGVQLGPELDFLWTRTEKIRCESGMKVIDKQLLFVPNFGFILYPESIVNLYAGLELDYRVIYDRGIIFDIFFGGAYCQRFGSDKLPLGEQDFETVIMDSRSAFLPTFGMGTGYDFHKRVFGGPPIIISLRAVNASLSPSTDFYNPCIQLGCTIGVQ